MERYSARTIDELSRLILPQELMKKIGLKPGNNVYLKIIENLVIVQHEENSTEPDAVVCQISERGRITMPAKVKTVLGWKEKDKVAFYHSGNMIILKAA